MNISFLYKGRMYLYSVILCTKDILYVSSVGILLQMHEYKYQKSELLLAMIDSGAA